MAPWRASTSFSTASIIAASRTSRRAPSPSNSRSASEIVAAPASVVAVPTTFAPLRASASAIARPMPRVAPVTSATFPASAPWS